MSTETDIYFNQAAETTSQDELKSLQNEKLIRIVRYATENNPYFAELYKKAGVDVGDFRGIEDLAKLPTISKANFRETYPMGMCCVPKNTIREMHM